MNKTDELVVMAAEQITRNSQQEWRCECEVKQTLWERKRLLDAKENWVWNEKNKKRFVQISDALYKHCKKGWDIAVKKAMLLEEQIAAGDAFFDDYEIEVSINPYGDLWQTGEDVDEDTREDVSSYISEECLPILNMRISHIHYERHMEKSEEDSEILIDRNWNYNGEYLDDQFENDYICYAMHLLLESHVWSYGDICNIENIFCEVSVDYQKSNKVPLLEDWRDEDESK